MQNPLKHNWKWLRRTGALRLEDTVFAGVSVAEHWDARDSRGQWSIKEIMEPPKTKHGAPKPVFQKIKKCVTVHMQPPLCQCEVLKGKYKSSPCVKQTETGNAPPDPSGIHRAAHIKRQRWRQAKNKRVQNKRVRECDTWEQQAERGWTSIDINIMIQKNPRNILSRFQALPNITLSAPLHRAWQTQRQGNTLKEEPEWDRSADIQRLLSVTTFVV